MGAVTLSSAASAKSVTLAATIRTGFAVGAALVTFMSSLDRPRANGLCKVTAAHHHGHRVQDFRRPLRARFMHYPAAKGNASCLSNRP
jgi:hypothetical protein